MESLAVVGWKANKVTCGGVQYFQPVLEARTGDAPYAWHVVFDVGDFECWQYQWSSPARRLAANMKARRAATSSSSSAAPAQARLFGCFAQVIGSPEPLLQGAARLCFPEFPFSMLSKLVELQGLDLPASTSAFETMQALVVACVPGLWDGMGVGGGDC